MWRKVRVLIAIAVVIEATSPSAEAIPIVNYDQTVKQVEAALLPEGKDNVLLMVWGPIDAGTEVRGTKELVLTAPEDGYIVYIDDYPAANLFHPVRYAFVSSVGGEIRVAEASSPPLNFRDYRPVETRIGRMLQAAQNRRAPLPHIAPPLPRSDRWAVLLNGGYNAGNNHVRFWNDLSNIYITLNWTYGFADEQIIVLCSDGLDPAPDQSNGTSSDPDLDGDGDDDIMYPCLLGVVDMLFDSLANLLTEDDKLFIFVTDHGDNYGTPWDWDVCINLWNYEELSDHHFAALLDPLPTCEIISTIGCCFSGGFLDDLIVPPGPRVVSTACPYNTLSWSLPPYEYCEYLFHWTAAVKGEDAYGHPVNADHNGDGIVTMDEAFLYAEIHTTTSAPQYGDYPIGVGTSLSLWPTGSGPYLMVSRTTFVDTSGNNNGAPDPGETISMTVTLSNVGNATASNIIGTLSSTDPYLAITQSVSCFPDLGQFEQGQGSPAYVIEVSQACPQGQMTSCDIHIEADSAYTTDLLINFIVGDPIYDPIGPDTYGYYAYDVLDQPSGPTYDWIEISPDSGGPGTLINFTQDDQVLHYGLPFTFQYYGVSYDSFTVSTNGWIGMGVITDDDYSNSAIPDGDGPSSMIAPYWEDLSPQRTNSGRVWQWYDEVNHRLIVEYNHIEQYSPTGSFETFQAILLDPEYHPTATGDGQLIFQYKEMSAIAQSEGTVGIENHDENIGIQYLFDGNYDIHAAPINSGMAILFTTISAFPDVIVELAPYGLPIQIPASGGSFSFNISVTNNESSAWSFHCWCDVTLPSGSNVGPLLGPAALTLAAATSTNRDRDQYVPGSAPAGAYSYNAHVGIYPSVIWSSDCFDFEKEGGDKYGSLGSPSDWPCTGQPFDLDLGFESLPEVYALHAPYPNPFNPMTTFRIELPEVSWVQLEVYDINGRVVGARSPRLYNSGIHHITFDGSGLASGIYFYRLQAGDFTASGKMVLMK